MAHQDGVEEGRSRSRKADEESRRWAVVYRRAGAHDLTHFRVSEFAMRANLLPIRPGAPGIGSEGSPLMIEFIRSNASNASS